jgi:hypothetical protein
LKNRIIIKDNYDRDGGEKLPDQGKSGKDSEMIKSLMGITEILRLKI